MEAPRARWVGHLAMLGGILALVLAPILVTVKYMTGWAIIPEPFWVPAAKTLIRATFPTATPAELWMGFGTVYSLSLSLMLGGLLALAPQLQRPRGAQRVGYWLVLGGLALVIPGDAIHTWTWHQDGLTTPTPGTNFVANTAYAAHMMGMNLVMIGSSVLGVTALRRRTLAPWVSWLFVLVFPAALFASVVLLPTTPSGALWLFSLLIASCGYLLARGRQSQLVAA